MEGKKPLVMASLLMIMLASFAVIAPTPTVSAQYPKTHRYVVMEGILNSWTQLDAFGVSQSPYTTRAPYLTPYSMEQNITFGPAWNSVTYGWIVNQTIPWQTFVGVYHEWFDTISGLYFNLRHYLDTDGYGWVFLNSSEGDVDCCTFNNKTGVFWGRKNATFASPKAGQLAALTGKVPSVGPDGVAGTGDDGFGDGTPDLKGSGVMILPSKLRCEWYNTTPPAKWQLLFDTDWPVTLTTGTAYDIVNDTGPAYPAAGYKSLLQGRNATVTGQRWQFLAGASPTVDPEHQGDPDYGPVPYDNENWNKYASVACVWSMINLTTKDFGRLDVMFYLKEKVVKESWVDPHLFNGLPPGYYVIPDINCDEIVDIFDVVICAATFGSTDEGLGKPVAGPPPLTFDARGDVKPDGLIDIFDFVIIASWFGCKVTNHCIVLP